VHLSSSTHTHTHTHTFKYIHTLNTITHLHTCKTHAYKHTNAECAHKNGECLKGRKGQPITSGSSKRNAGSFQVRVPDLCMIALVCQWKYSHSMRLVGTAKARKFAQTYMLNSCLIYARAHTQAMHTCTHTHTHAHTHTSPGRVTTYDLPRASTRALWLQFPVKTVKGGGGLRRLWSQSSGPARGRRSMKRWV